MSAEPRDTAAAAAPPETPGAGGPRPDAPRPAWRRWLPIALIALGAGAGYALFGDQLSFAALKENRQALIAWRDANYWGALATFMALYVAVVAFSIPGATWMTIGGGFLFGLIAGSAATVIAATLGATAIFLAARTSLGASLRTAAGPWLRRLEAGFRENEISYLLVLRLVPAVPFFIANLAPAFLGARLWAYGVTTLFGIMPASVVYTSVGVGVGEVIDRGDEPDLSLLFAPEIIGPLLALAALSLLPVAIKAVRGRPVAPTPPAQERDA